MLLVCSFCTYNIQAIHVACYLCSLSLLSGTSIEYRLVNNVCESDTSASRPKVPLAVTSHILR